MNRHRGVARPLGTGAAWHERIYQKLQIKGRVALAIQVANRA